jgi:hypothetical protein
MNPDVDTRFGMIFISRMLPIFLMAVVFPSVIITAASVTRKNTADSR